jgi:hypothetical protein
LRFIEECAKVRDMLRRWAVDTSQVKDKSAWTVPAKKKEEGLMKKQSFLMAGLLVLSSMAATQVARAQESMVVDIPFAFVAANATLPAGEYRVQKLDGNSAVLLIHCWDANASALVITNAAQAKEPQSESKLVFKRYGNSYFLSQVWTAGSIRGRQLSISPREKEMPQLARNETKGEVTLVARLSTVRP